MLVLLNMTLQTSEDNRSWNEGTAHGKTFGKNGSISYNVSLNFGCDNITATTMRTKKKVVIDFYLQNIDNAKI